MYHGLHLFRAALAALVIGLLANAASAQTGRVGGTVKDEGGQPIKGATVTAENPNASPNSFTATTDDKGRFSIIGLRSGGWTFTAQAPGFAAESGKASVQTIGAANPPITFTLKKGGSGPASALGATTPKELQAELAAADQLYNGQKWDDAIAAYKTILAKTPSLSMINVQIGAAYHNKKEFDNAIAAFNEALKPDPNNVRVLRNLGTTYLEKPDLQLADETWSKVAKDPAATREDFYTLGEVKFNEGQADEAATWYQKAADADATWGKPLFKLALVQLNKGDKDGTIKALEKLIAVDPTSQEAAQAKAVIEQLKK